MPEVEKYDAAMLAFSQGEVELAIARLSRSTVRLHFDAIDQEHIYHIECIIVSFDNDSTTIARDGDEVGMGNLDRAAISQVQCKRLEGAFAHYLSNGNCVHGHNLITLSGESRFSIAFNSATTKGSFMSRASGHRRDEGYAFGLGVGKFSSGLQPAAQSQVAPAGPGDAGAPDCAD